MRRIAISNTYLHSAVLVVTVSGVGALLRPDLGWSLLLPTLAFQAFIQHNNTKSHYLT